MDYSYPALGAPNPNAPLSVGGAAQQYDAAGGLMQDGTRAYHYNVSGQLERVVEGGIDLAAFEYDGSGARVGSSETAGGVERKSLGSDFDYFPSHGMSTTRIGIGKQLAISHSEAYVPSSGGGGGCAGAPPATPGRDSWIELGLLLLLTWLASIASLRLRRVGAIGATALATAIPLAVVVPAVLLAPLPAGANIPQPETLYIHADLLGTAVATSSASGVVSQRVEDRNFKGPFYTLGHVRYRQKRGHRGSPVRAGVRRRKGRESA